ncbi:MAG: hypothetical protein SF052_21830 [Bacteroidia bacterium]|nr:hypothetical protein [Bacteroidia bacterium]
MTLTVYTYLIYLLTSLMLTLWVGRSLFHNGRAFLLEIFHGKETLADSINQLLLVGFYLVNIGYISLTMYIGMDIRTFEEVIEKLSYKIGMIMIVLAGIHFLNLIVLYRMRRGRTPEMG